MASLTVEQALGKAIRDPGGKVITAAEMTQFVLNHVLPSATFSAQLVAAGYWRIAGDGALWQPDIDEEAGATYEYYNGYGGGYTTFSFKLLTGTDTRDPVSVTGSRVNFNACLEEILVWAANHRALEYSQSMGGGSITPETARQQLISQAEIVRGVVSL